MEAMINWMLMLLKCLLNSACCEGLDQKGGDDAYKLSLLCYFQ